jgi:hypothetical protein
MYGVYQLQGSNNQTLQIKILNMIRVSKAFITLYVWICAHIHTHNLDQAFDTRIKYVNYLMIN